MSESRGRMWAFSFFYVVEGVFYLVYSIWRTVINPFQFFRAPPGLETMAQVFVLIMLVAAVFFLYRAFMLLPGWTRLSIIDLYASISSMPLWILPALFSWGNANSYLNGPYIPADLRPYGYYYLNFAVAFTAVGVINIASILYLILLRFRRESVSSKS